MAEKICKHCGTVMPKGKRKYCSESCGGKYRLRIRKPDVQAKLWQHEAEVFEAAMAMYWRGYGGAEIARYFEIPVNTAYSWIHDFGEKRECTEISDAPKAERSVIKTPKERFRQAESAGEWLDVLRESTATAEDTFTGVSIRLVCGGFRGQSAGTLAAVIYESLKENPLSGKSYAFCSRNCRIITVIAWKDPIYELSKYVKVHGTFTWPGENLGQTIEVTRSEFERLLFMKKQRKSSVKSP